MPDNPNEPSEQYNGLSYYELNQLATYNAERSRGIVHTPEWDAKMAALQRRFNEGRAS
jgi:hypothetical protein